MTPFNEHIRLAISMVHGHLYIDPAPNWMEHVTVKGHDYILHPPLSAIICVPFVFFGIDDQQLISIIFGSVSIALCYHLTKNFWTTMFFAFGTTFAYEAMNGASWDFALVASTPFTFLTLIGIKDRWPASAVGITMGLASLARYDLALAIPILIAKARNRSIAIFIGPALALATYVCYNYFRFGTLNDISLWLWYFQDSYRSVSTHGPFSIYYLPFALYTLFYMAPNFSHLFPWLRPQSMGQSLLSLSPAFLMVRPSLYLLAAIVASIPSLTVYANGFTQLGCRYYIQIFPLLIASMPTDPDRRTKTLIVVSIISSLYATMVVMKWGLT